MLLLVYVKRNVIATNIILDILSRYGTFTHSLSSTAQVSLSKFNLHLKLYILPSFNIIPYEYTVKRFLK